ncbi:hypothetical protein M406DRAFT_325257 [Cryphonectria parasitica EP155]|uniref:Uncharacterized protein n=1 Tax=Cryphonectria parasitica (strain ATCC 38755 / EP155) TaxID=660469 RepID=A0A9P5CSY8_CRYP1|nr:uncharacterized protein M406DRAFT_325257 [Cryphonectria parasitica EP155]KAF3769773.1 hypothetical protein M406DRAFT_325257 [Cryphonectria parasitica EP155]
MSTESETTKRYSQRKRVTISYTEDHESEELGGNNDALSQEDGNSDDDLKQSASKDVQNLPEKAQVFEQQPPAFRFMLTFVRYLPGEIRNMIYKLVVLNKSSQVSLESVSLVNISIRRRLAERTCFINSLRNLRLLRVSKIVYQEASSLMYGQKFFFNRLVALQTFLLHLRPQSMVFIRAVGVGTTSSEWQLLPGVSAQVAQLKYLESLSISGLDYTISEKSFDRYLRQTNRPISGWQTSIESMDKYIGTKLARDTFPYIFPFYEQVIHERGVDALVQILSFPAWQHEIFKEGGRRLGKFERLRDVPDSDERKSRRAKIFGDEVVFLLSQDV